MRKTGGRTSGTVEASSRAGRSWTDHGTARWERGLEDRAVHESRTSQGLEVPGWG
jgi:hypothetical protein